MGAATLRRTIDETAAARFMLDSHHLAMLDRFVAQARREARRSGRQFNGVVIEVDPTRAVSVQVADLKPLVLKPAAGHRALSSEL